MKILYIGWVGSKNIGDELMLDCFKNLAKEKFGMGCVVHGIMCGENFNDFDKYDVVCLGGGLYTNAWFCKCFAQSIKEW
ncbi:hypothetical protein [Clostridium sp. B9]|uniref:hypothetical protein n=1 Tax=Clostridium sp. B9 TaxID=3423224 RepID=UPI003D2EA7BB